MPLLHMGGRRRQAKTAISSAPDSMFCALSVPGMLFDGSETERVFRRLLGPLERARVQVQGEGGMATAEDLPAPVGMCKANGTGPAVALACRRPAPNGLVPPRGGRRGVGAPRTHRQKLRCRKGAAGAALPADRPGPAAGAASARQEPPTKPRGISSRRPRPVTSCGAAGLRRSRAAPPSLRAIRLPGGGRTQAARCVGPCS